MKENHNKEQKLDLEWTMYSSNGPKRHFHSAKILGDLMYAFGGGDGVNWLNDLYAYNLKTHD
jgi:hypothetical protein